MTRAADRILARSPGTPQPFATRAFGTSEAQAAAIAAAAARTVRPGIRQADGTIVGGRVAGATGAGGTGTNLTTSTYSASGGGAPARGSERA